MACVEGFVIPVKTARIVDFVRMAEVSAAVFRDHGATSVVESIGVDTPHGDLTSFPRAVLAREDETVVFAWVTYPSREIRDEAVRKAADDPRMAPFMDDMPLDRRRMIYGVFEIAVQA